MPSQFKFLNPLVHSLVAEGDEMANLPHSLRIWRNWGGEDHLLTLFSLVFLQLRQT